MHVWKKTQRVTEREFVLICAKWISTRSAVLCCVLCSSKTWAMEWYVFGSLDTQSHAVCLPCVIRLPKKPARMRGLQGVLLTFCAMQACKLTMRPDLLRKSKNKTRFNGSTCTSGQRVPSPLSKLGCVKKKKPSNMTNELWITLRLANHVLRLNKTFIKLQQQCF